MTLDNLAPELRIFILEQIHSIEQLEILLLLEADRSKSWTPEMVAKELRSSARSAERWLVFLKSRKLLVESFRYQAENETLDSQVRELRMLYTQKRVSLIELIFNKPAKKMQSFANAFRVKEDKNDG